MFSRNRPSHVQANLSLSTKVILLPASLLLGLGIAFIGGTLMLMLMNVTECQWLAPKGIIPDMGNVTVGIALLGMMLGKTVYSSISEWVFQRVFNLGSTRLGRG